MNRKRFDQQTLNIVKASKINRFRLGRIGRANEKFIKYIVSKLGILNKPGDRLEARITDSNRRVVKVQTDNGNSKYSATQYPNGTLVETKVTKQK